MRVKIETKIIVLLSDVEDRTNKIDEICEENHEKNISKYKRRK